MRRSYQMIFKILYTRVLNSSTTDFLECIIDCGKGSVQCTIGYLAASLLSAHWMPVANLTYPSMTTKKKKSDIAKCPWKGKFTAGWKPMPFKLNFMTNALLLSSKLLRFFPVIFFRHPISLLNIFKQFLISIMPLLHVLLFPNQRYSNQFVHMLHGNGFKNWPLIRDEVNRWSKHFKLYCLIFQYLCV